MQPRTSPVKFSLPQARRAPEVTRLQRDLSTGSAAAEVAFWRALEGALLAARVEMAMPEIDLTLGVLRGAAFTR